MNPLTMLLMPLARANAMQVSRMTLPLPSAAAATPSAAKSDSPGGSGSGSGASPSPGRGRSPGSASGAPSSRRRPPEQLRLVPVVRLRFATEALRKQAHARLTADMTDLEPLGPLPTSAGPTAASGAAAPGAPPEGRAGGAGAEEGQEQEHERCPVGSQPADPRVLAALKERDWDGWTFHHALTPAQLEYVYDTHAMLRRVAAVLEADPARRGLLRVYRRTGGRVWLQGRGEGATLLDVRVQAGATGAGTAGAGMAAAGQKARSAGATGSGGGAGPGAAAWGKPVPLYDPAFSLDHFLRERGELEKEM